MDWFTFMCFLCKSVVVKRELSQKVNLSIYQLIFVQNTHLWSRVLSHDRKNEVQDPKSRSEFLLHVGAKAKSLVIWSELGLDSLLL